MGMGPAYKNVFFIIRRKKNEKESSKLTSCISYGT